MRKEILKNTSKSKNPKPEAVESKYTKPHTSNYQPKNYILADSSYSDSDSSDYLDQEQYLDLSTIDLERLSFGPKVVVNPKLEKQRKLTQQLLRLEQLYRNDVNKNADHQKTTTASLAHNILTQNNIKAIFDAIDDYMQENIMQNNFLSSMAMIFIKIANDHKLAYYCISKEYLGDEERFYFRIKEEFPFQYFDYRDTSKLKKDIYRLFELSIKNINNSTPIEYLDLLINIAITYTSNENLMLIFAKCKEKGINLRPLLIKKIGNMPPTPEDLFPEEDNTKRELLRAKRMLLKYVGSLIRNAIEDNSNNGDAYLRDIFTQCENISLNLNRLRQNIYFLKYATSKRYNKTIGILIENGFNPLSIDRNSHNFFSYACLNSHNEKALSKYIKTLEVDLVKSGQESKIGVSNIIIQLLSQLDYNKNNPFDLAVSHGRYLKSVNFLANLCTQYNIKIDYNKNILTTIIHNDPKIFYFLLEKKEWGAFKADDKIFLDEIITQICHNERSVLAKKLFNFAQKNTFIAKVMFKHKNISLLSNLVEVNEQLGNIHNICSNHGTEHLEPYLKNLAQEEKSNPKFLAKFLDEFVDKEGRSALFCAVQGKCYLGNIKLLIKSGANPNIKGFVSLIAVPENSESLGFLLRSNSLNQESINLAARHIINQNNEILTSSFILNISNKALASLKPAYQEILLKQTIQNGNLDNIKRMIPVLILSLPDIQKKPTITTLLEHKDQKNSFNKKPKSSISKASINKTSYLDIAIQSGSDAMVDYLMGHGFKSLEKPDNCIIM